MKGRKGEQKKSETEKKGKGSVDNRRWGESSPIHGYFFLLI
jgi:hypothetical protein